jgi:hypothetical protein
MGVKNLIRSLFVVAALAAPNAAHASIQTDTLSAAATTYVGHPVKIVCVQTDANLVALLTNLGANPTADAFAEPENNRAYLRGWDCGVLYRWATGVGDAQQEGQALEIFTHESTHLTGIIDEGQTECAAVKNVWRMMRILNPHATTQRSKTAYRAAVASHNSQTGAYRSVC